MRVFITGATGFVGRALVLRLRRDGHTPVAWVRSMQRGHTLLGREAELVDVQGGDAALDKALSGCSGVINLAGENIMAGRWTQRRKQALIDSRVQTTENLVHSLQRISPRPKTLISASAIGYYGERGVETVDEEAAAGNDFLAELCVKWEEAARRAQTFGVRVALVRIGLVLGHEGGLLGQLLPMFMAGLGGQVGSGHQYMSWIHLHDLVESMVQALGDERYNGPYNAVCSQPVTNKDFTAALAAACNTGAPFGVPKVALRMAMGEKATAALSSTRVTPATLRRNNFNFGFETLEAALRDLIDPEALRIVALDDKAHQPMSHAYVKTRKPIYLLEAKTPLRQSRSEVFKFFCQAENLGLMTPVALAMQIIGKVPEPMQQGNEISYALKVGPVPLRWRTLIAHWEPDCLFVDAQLNGPYRAWWHQHHFEDNGSGTQMVDRVYYAAPLSFLGRVANSLMIKGQLCRIFWYRKSAITLRFGRN